jgi:hypothetical protein
MYWEGCLVPFHSAQNKRSATYLRFLRWISRWSRSPTQVDNISFSERVTKRNIFKVFLLGFILWPFILRVKYEIYGPVKKLSLFPGSYVTPPSPFPPVSLVTMDEIPRQTPNPKCRLYWCLLEFMDWRCSQSCWYFRPLL